MLCKQLSYHYIAAKTNHSFRNGKSLANAFSLFDLTKSTSTIHTYHKSLLNFCFM